MNEEKFWKQIYHTHHNKINDYTGIKKKKRRRRIKNTRNKSKGYENKTERKKIMKVS